MDPITADMGIDGAIDAVASRAEQVVRNESSALVERKTNIYNLQRKIKAQKDQIDSKVTFQSLVFLRELLAESSSL